ncbi:multidrug effflux MFS transporter [Hylemonella sp. W303a]|uniref:multidrug effflux MFS transporter n=1 Tax=Hylemonella sp. W303a TaxID=3389873 RepID=UPI00396B083A
MQQNFLRTALVLGLLSAVGPLGIDLYLPALPLIGQELQASIGAVQASLMIFFIALGVGQLVYGPVSDMLGRKPPLYFGLVLFAVGSVGCAFAPNVEFLLFMRFFQGLGACACTVIPRAVVRDLYTGHEALRMMSMLMLVFSVAPILAPLLGSFLIDALGWRSSFWGMLGASLLGLLLMGTQLRETRPAEVRATEREARVGHGTQKPIGDWSMVLGSYRTLVTDRHFLGLVFIGAFGIAAFFTYLANSSFVLINHYGLTTRQFSIAFASNAAAFIGMSQLTSRLSRRFGLKPMVRVAAHGHAAVMLTLLMLFALGVEALPVMLGLLFIGFGFLGLIVPTSAILALESHGPIAGTASALLGTLQFGTGALMIAISGQVADGTGLPMVACIAGAATMTWIFAQATLRKGSATEPSRSASART